MEMILKNIATRAKFTKENQSFWLDIELEGRGGGGVQHCVMNFEKDTSAKHVAKKLKCLVHKLGEA